MAMTLGIGWQTWIRYEKGERAVPSYVIDKLIQMGINPLWLFTGEGEMELKLPEGWPPPGAHQVEQIPVFGHIPAGWPEKIEAQEKPLSYIYVPKDWISTGTIALVVQGDSMVPTLKNGEIALVEPVSSPPKDGTIVVASWNGEYTIKEIRHTQHKILLIPHNPKFRTIELDPEISEIRIIGRIYKIINIRDLQTP